METACLDTTFLNDLQRSSRNEGYKRATAWLAANPTVILQVPAIVLGEFSVGFEDIAHPEIQAIYQRHEVLPVTTSEALLYGRHYRAMKSAGCLVGSNDLWIACTALGNQLPLVTRNPCDFARIPELELVEY